jgi:glutamate-1-semialdehyde 2,1-aminomutase
MEASTQIPLKRYKSQEIYERSCGVIPGGVNSPVRSFPGLAQTPLVAERGSGDKVTDSDGYSYIDYCGSWGALIHGHAHPKIVEAATSRVELGSSFGMTTAIEAQLAECIVEHVPGIEKIRFVSSGTEATMSAIRLARGFTDRQLIVKFNGNFHGHADAFLVQAGSGLVHLTPTSSSAGVPADYVKHTLSLPYNDIEVCRQVLRSQGSQVAAVILEPIAANMGLVVPSLDFISMLREETEKQGTLLIFDEVITGFRIALGGAAEYFGIVPDLSCFGKIIGGGFPAAAFGGKAEIMDRLAPLGPVYQAGTLSGNPVAMAAGLQSVRLCTEENFYQTLEAHTALLTDPIQALIEQKNLDLCLHRVGSLFTLFFGRKEVRNFEDVKGCDVRRFNRFFQILFQKGIYLAPSQFEANFVSTAHTTENLLYTSNCILEALLA